MPKITDEHEKALMHAIFKVFDCKRKYGAGGWVAIESYDPQTKRRIQ